MACFSNMRVGQATPRFGDLFAEDNFSKIGFLGIEESPTFIGDFNFSVVLTHVCLSY